MPKIVTTLSTIRPHSIDVSVDPYDPNVCQLALFVGPEHRQGVHYVLLTRAGMKGLAERIERKLRQIPAQK